MHLPRPPAIARGAIVVAQIVALWLFHRLGQALVTAWHLPIPAAVVGIVIVFTLLALGILREEWLAAASDLLLRHLAFFFIPVAVGIMVYRELLRQHGLAFAFIVVVSTVIGVAVAGRAAAGATVAGAPAAGATAPAQDT